MNSGPASGTPRPTTAVSDPQFELGRWRCSSGSSCAATRPSLDAGCGSRPRHRRAAVERLPDGRVLAVDGSEAMVEKARERLRRRRDLPRRRPLRAGARRAGRPGLLDRGLPLDPRPRPLFARLRAALAAGRAPGRPVRRRGQRRRARAGDRARSPPRARVRAPLRGHERDLELRRRRGDRSAAARRRLRGRPLLAAAEAGAAAGARCEFTATVTLGPQLARLPEELRGPFAEAVLDASEQPLALDYVRLNIEAVAA